MKKMKMLAVIMVAVLALCMCTTAFAQGKIYVDLVEVESDTSPRIINDRTMVPVRAITEMLGYDVYWIAEKQQVEICEKGDTVPVIIMNINETRAYYSKYEEELGDSVGCEVELDSPAVIINDRTFVPLRFVAEAVGCIVDYDNETADVFLFTQRFMSNYETEGKGEDKISDKDGKGEVIPLTYEEMEYVLGKTTKQWLDMNEEEKAEFAVLVSRWWEDYANVIIEDYADFVKTIDHQAEQYYKNEVDESVFVTACDIYDVDETVFIEE